MALPVFIAAAGTIAQSSGAIAGLLGGHPKDQERYAANRAAYEAALGGDDNALLFLKQRTGQYGVAQVPGYGEIGEWATDGPIADAKVKYNAALAARRGETALTTAAQSFGGKVQSAVDQVAGKAGETAGRQVGMAIFVAAIVILAAVWFMTRRRRGA